MYAGTLGLGLLLPATEMLVVVLLVNVLPLSVIETSTVPVLIDDPAEALLAMSNVTSTVADPPAETEVVMTPGGVLPKSSLLTSPDVLAMLSSEGRLGNSISAFAAVEPVLSTVYDTVAVPPGVPEPPLSEMAGDGCAATGAAPRLRTEPIISTERISAVLLVRVIVLIESKLRGSTAEPPTGSPSHFADKYFVLSQDADVFTRLLEAIETPVRWVVRGHNRSVRPRERSPNFAYTPKRLSYGKPVQCDIPHVLEILRVCSLDKLEHIKIVH